MASAGSRSHGLPLHPLTRAIYLSVPFKFALVSMFLRNVQHSANYARDASQQSQYCCVSAGLGGIKMQLRVKAAQVTVWEGLMSGGRRSCGTASQHLLTFLVVSRGGLLGELGLLQGEEARCPRGLVLPHGDRLSRGQALRRRGLVQTKCRSLKPETFLVSKT